MNRFALLLLVALIPACESKVPPPPATNPVPPVPTAPIPAATTFPELGEGEQLDGGIRVHRLTVNRAGSPMQLWVYQPKPAANAKPGDKQPCVFIAPAGSPMMIGLELTPQDDSEHLPYAQAGYLVVAYSLDGHVPEKQRPVGRIFLAGLRKYKASIAGLENAKAAIDFASAKLNVDPQRLTAAGHSSAATHAMMVARLDPRIKACVSYAPCLDVVGWLSEDLDDLDQAVPGYRAFMKSTSPAEFPTEPKCPTFLFHAKDDTICKYAESAAFAAKLKASNANLKFVTVEEGGHTDSMYESGIPAAVRWMDGLVAKSNAK